MRFVKKPGRRLSDAETSDRALDAQRISNSRIRPIYCMFRRIRLKSQIAQNAIFELLGGCRKCSAYIQKAIRHGRGGGIRTPDPLLPKQMRYQTALRPDSF